MAIPDTGTRCWGQGQAAKTDSAAARIGVMAAEAHSRDAQKVDTAVAALVVAVQSEEEEERRRRRCRLLGLELPFTHHMKPVHSSWSSLDISRPIHWQKVTRGLALSCTADCSWSCMPVFCESRSDSLTIASPTLFPVPEPVLDAALGLLSHGA